MNAKPLFVAAISAFLFNGPVLLAAEEKTIPGIGIRLVKIAHGSFILGHPEGYAGSSRDERPGTPVTITRDFWLGATEVSVGQFRFFVETTGYITDAEMSGGFVSAEGIQPGLNWRNPGYRAGFVQEDNHPVVGVSWRDAQQFCRWLTEREGSAGRLPPGYVYRLPTEAQWEYAARAGSTDDLADPGDYAWFAENSGGVAHPVGTKKPNPWGLHDMQGNVWEWVHDWYGHYPKDPVVDPQGPATANSPEVIRPLRENRGGGAGSAGGHGIMTTNRWSTWGIVQNRSKGFRIALSTVPPPPPPAPPASAKGAPPAGKKK